MKKIFCFIVVLFTVSFSSLTYADDGENSWLDWFGEERIPASFESEEKIPTSSENEVSRSSTSNGWSIKDVLKDTTDPIVDIKDDDGLDMLSKLLRWFKTELMSLVSVLVIWVFIFIGIRIVMSRWDPEWFKKAMLHFVYAVIWVFFIFIAWWLVRLIYSLSL